MEFATTGTLELTGEAAVSLTGTYEDTTLQIMSSGGGFAFDGIITSDGAELTGSYTGPGGAAGGFSTLNDTLSTVTDYCGSYSGGGIWNMTIDSNGRLIGLYVDSDGSSGFIRGQLTGNSLSLTADGGVTASGTLQGTTLSGTWSDGEDSGSWSGSVC